MQGQKKKMTCQCILLRYLLTHKLRFKDHKFSATVFSHNNGALGSNIVKNTPESRIYNLGRTVGYSIFKIYATLVLVWIMIQVWLSVRILFLFLQYYKSYFKIITPVIKSNHISPLCYILLVLNNFYCYIILWRQSLSERSSKYMYVWILRHDHIHLYCRQVIHINFI